MKHSCLNNKDISKSLYHGFEKTCFAIAIAIGIVCVSSCKKEEEEPPPTTNYLYVDNFNGNESTWPVGENEFVNTYFEDGKYIIEHKDDNPNHSYMIYYWGEVYGNYTMETDISELEGHDDFIYGLEFLRKDSYNKHLFYLNKDKYYIGFLYNYKYHHIVEWEGSDYIELEGEPNNLKVVKTKNYLEFFINGEKVYQYDAQIIVGESFGFDFNMPGKIAIDFIKVFR